MSIGSSRRRKVQKAQGTFEGAFARKQRLAAEKVAAEKASQAPKGWDKVEGGPEQAKVA